MDKVEKGNEFLHFLINEKKKIETETTSNLIALEEKEAKLEVLTDLIEIMSKKELGNQEDKIDRILESIF